MEDILTLDLGSPFPHSQDVGDGGASSGEDLEVAGNGGDFRDPEEIASKG